MAIDGNQRTSISTPQLSSNRWESMGINGNQWESMAINSQAHLHLDAAIKQQSMAINGN